MERIKQYKEISKRPMKKVVTTVRKDSISDTLDVKKVGKFELILVNYLFYMSL